MSKQPSYQALYSDIRELDEDTTIQLIALVLADLSVCLTDASRENGWTYERSINDLVERIRVQAIVNLKPY